ncbi:hypothetical protein D3C71_1663610 [compost metagenome]
MHDSCLDLADNVMPFLDRQLGRYSDAYIQHDILSEFSGPEPVDALHLGDSQDERLIVPDLFNRNRLLHQNVDGILAHMISQADNKIGNDNAGNGIAIAQNGDVEPTADQSQPDSGNRRD